jgi:hypothetical protein
MVYDCPTLNPLPPLIPQAASVRAAAGEAFQTLHIMVGQAAVNEVVPALVRQLATPDAKDADVKEDMGAIDGELVLAGIRQILTTHSRLVLPFLIPQLSKRPLSLEAAAALSSLSGTV